MPTKFRVSSLIPTGLIVDSVVQAGDAIIVTAHAGAQTATCPLCCSPSQRIHSRYIRAADRGWRRRLCFPAQPTRRRRTEKASDKQLRKVPSAQTIARLMTIARDHLSKADTVTIAAIEAGVPTLVDARKLIDRFHATVRKRIEAHLDPWIEAASQSFVV